MVRLAAAQAAAAEAKSERGGKGKGGGGKQKPLTRKEKARLEELERKLAKDNKKKDAQAKHALRRARERGKWRADDIECRKEMAAFAIQLFSLGLKARTMAGDGNCLFRALADQILNNAGKHSLVREQICSHMQAHQDNFAPFVEDDKPWDRYLADMRRLATWGGNLEIQAASVVYEVNIAIHQPAEPTWQVVNWPTTQRMINISFHDGDHYNSVHPLSPEEQDPVARQKAIEKTNQMVADSANANADEEIIMQCTGCYDLALVKKLMARCRNDTDTVIDLICTVAPELGKEWQDDVIDALLKQYQAGNPDFFFLLFFFFSVKFELEFNILINNGFGQHDNSNRSIQMELWGLYA